MFNFKPEKLKNVLCDFILKTSYVFTLIVFVFSLIGVLFTGSDVQVSALPCSMLLWTILFSVFISLINIICNFVNMKIKNSIIQLTLHFVLCYIAFLVVYVFGGGAAAYLNESAVTNTAFKIIVMTLIFVGIYVIISVVKIAFAAASKKLTNNKNSYKKIYTDIDKEN